ncbi:hypothetical protein CSC17_5057 [Klebsiella oxytoca]|nr:hypothetical protein CSC17_5057 [Klebsiella oxytoca]
MSNEYDKSTIKKKNNTTHNIYDPCCLIDVLSSNKKRTIFT